MTPFVIVYNVRRASTAVKASSDYPPFQFWPPEDAPQLPLRCALFRNAVYIGTVLLPI